jgi:hypothetical protein
MSQVSSARCQVHLYYVLVLVLGRGIYIQQLQLRMQRTAHYCALATAHCALALALARQVLCQLYSGAGTGAVH